MVKKGFVIVLVFLLAVNLNYANKPAKVQDDKPKRGLAIGNIAPAIIEKSVDGTEMKLEDTRGKIVLIDFWASWCGPCRRENPNIVKTYHKFKDKKFKGGDGFTVFSVSLDRSKDAWVKGIKADKLEWPYHVSDLKFWSSRHAAIYRVRSIPNNYLIDGNGIILAKGLRGPALEAFLTKLEK